jgi:hypothetical protein
MHYPYDTEVLFTNECFDAVSVLVLPNWVEAFYPERSLGAVDGQKAPSPARELLSLIYPRLQVASGSQQTHAGPDQLEVRILQCIVFF